ncbi:LytR family transcriptional regulator [Leekyejoonella antrihumi]|uniref:LytR family transcriptional regulator n=1 Tax=Leekyejoonella antrihumi TaxID=1660198 RepID=A0A563E931_9MICO|nr:LytR family transcriptional regulator [Leekyejoonella antrihumi]
MVLIVVLAGVGFALYLNHLLDSNVHHSALLPTTPGGPARVAQAGNAQNILLLGSDSRDPSNIHVDSRSDVIQLVHISNNYKSIQVIHFPRDLYVPIPGHGKNKINAAYAYGGAPLLVTTMQDMLGVHIDHVAQIGFTGFAKVTDDLGGVDVYVAQAFDENGFGHLTKGFHHMNGTQALGFVRERHQLKEGDIDRGRDQQAWIKAVLQKTLKAGTLLNPITLSNILDDITKTTVVDDGMTTAYMRDTALKLRNIRGNDLTFFTAPFTGFAYNKVAGDIDVVNEPKMKQLGHSLAIDDMSAYTGPRNTIR